jgi:hypothetical protein
MDKQVNVIELTLNSYENTKGILTVGFVPELYPQYVLAINPEFCVAVIQKKPPPLLPDVITLFKVLI